MTPFDHKAERDKQIAIEALGLDPLADMTPQRWQALGEVHRIRIRDLSGLHAQLKPFYGDRVEVVDMYGETRRFWVGRSTGWRPTLLELKRVDSSGGISADREYKSVRLIRKGPLG